MDVSFSTLGVAADISKKLTELGFTVPTPIQAQAIAPAMQGRDVIGIAQTGTGKTLAFGLPMIQHISRQRGNGQGLIILPTRELAEQVETTLLTVGRSFGLRTALVIGGAPMGRQVLALKRRPHVIIGTPGRIVDHLERKTIHLNEVTMLVLDEADRMLDMGFAPQVNAILAHVPKSRQTLLFSATMPQAIAQIANTQLRNPIRIELARSGSTAPVTQQLYIVDRQRKPALLNQFLTQAVGPVLVFTRTKHGARKLRTIIQDFGQSAAEIHGNRSLAQRREALAGFKSHRFHVLVATDVAARGIDVDQVELVVNYDLPDQPEDYVHRIGRTGRAGNAGRAVSFASPDQKFLIRSIERLLGKPIPRADVPSGMPTPQARPQPARQDRPANQPVTQSPAHQVNDSRDFYPRFTAERSSHQEQWSGERRESRGGSSSGNRRFQGRNQRHGARSRA